jgi:soluble lytic murein transglycosylase-like protein
VNDTSSGSSSSVSGTSSTGSDLVTTEELNSYFAEASATYGVDEKLLKAVAKAESNFNPSAVSSAGAIGIMQLMPSTAAGLGVSDSFDARENILGGAKYLSQLLNKYNGDTSLALAAYNAGSARVDEYGGIPPFTETQNYVQKVLAYYQG